MTAAETETYLGGVAGATLARKGFGFGGYEIHATNRRVFGIRALRHLPEIYAGLFITGEFYPVHSVNPADKPQAIIHDLERRKEFSVGKEEVRELLLVKPNWIQNGYLQITRTTGEKITVRIQGQRPFQMVFGLMKKFYPEAIKVS